MHDAKVVVEMSVDEIKKKSVIYSNSSQRYHCKIKDKALQDDSNDNPVFL